MSETTLPKLVSLLAVGGALLASMAATAQVQPPRPLPPGIIPAPRTFTPPPGVVPLDPGGIADMERRYEEDQERLRQQQADPELRQRDFDSRLQVLRDSSPDLARVLDIDADTEERLLRLLVDEEIGSNLHPIRSSDAGRQVLQPWPRKAQTACNEKPSNTTGSWARSPGSSGLSASMPIWTTWLHALPGTKSATSIAGCRPSCS